ncbi:MFS transporter [Schleiferilactobacillus harbinensis]|uniref:MFS transporter n=1 Tax=Schleiferilactobacillus harbinensis TaxID=304207 RepID=UPI00267220D5|nr:MFS transporter [Schleiferilactobacillus harbinensis]
MQQTTTQPTVDPHRWAVIIILGIFAFMSNLDSSIVNIAIPVMTRDLHVPASQMEWIVSLYLIVLSALLLLFGKLGDLWGKEKIFKLGTFVFILGSAMSGTPLGFNFLLLGRFVQAVGGAMTLANTYGIVTAEFPIKERGRAMGTVGTFVALGAVAGPGLGGLILAVSSWPYIFWINIPIGVIALIFALRLMHAGPAPVKGGVDWGGFLTQAVAIGAGFWGLNMSQQMGFTPLIWGLLGIAIVALIGFFIVENRVHEPLLPLRIFKNALFSGGVGAVYLVFVVQFFMTVLMPFYLEDTLRLPAGMAGALLTLYPLTMVFFAPLGGYLADRMNIALVGLIGAALIGLADVLYLFLPLSGGIVLYGVATVLLGMGTGLFQSPLGDIVMSVVPKTDLGITGSFNALARNLGMVTGTAASTSILFGVMSAQLGKRVTTYPAGQDSVFLSALHTAFGIAVVVAVLAVLVLAWMMPKIKKADLK